MRALSLALVPVAVVGVVLLLQGRGEPSGRLPGDGPAPDPSAPTSDPAPAPTADPVDAAGADVAAAGVPDGATLTPSPSLVVARPGTVIENRDVTGQITVSADDVTIRNTRVTGRGWTLVTIAPGATGTRIEHVELDGLGAQGAPGSTGIHGRASVVAADIHSVENGIIPFSGSVIRDSHVHDLAASGPDPHYDGIQLDGGQSDVLIEDNTVDLTNQDRTSAVMINNDFGPIRDVTVRGNHLAGGSYTVYADAKFSLAPITGVAFLDNRLGAGGYGYFLVRGSTVAWRGNVDATGGGEIDGP